jgi:hypothetical protein
VIRDTKVTKDDLETLLIAKDEMTDLDEAKREYFERIDDLRKRALRFFKLKNYNACIEYIDEIIETANYAYDLNVLKDIYNLKALVCIFFDDF